MRGIAAAVSVCFVTAFAACGRDDAGNAAGENSDAQSRVAQQTAEESSTPGPTKEAYVKRVNALCEEFNDRADRKIASAAQDAAAAGGSQKDVTAAAIEPFLPIMRRFMDEAAAVPRPPDAEEDLDDFWSELQGAVDLMEDFTVALRENDREAGVAINAQFLEIGAETRPFAEEYGLTACLPDQAGISTP